MVIGGLLPVKLLDLEKGPLHELDELGVGRMPYVQVRLSSPRDPPPDRRGQATCALVSELLADA